MKKALLLLFLLIAISNASEENQNLLSRCKCAKHALHQMQRALNNYASHLHSETPPELDDVIRQITDIAHSESSIW